MLHNNSVIYSWTVPGFQHQEKSKRWYWMFSIFALALVTLAIVLANYLLAFFIVLGSFLIFVHARSDAHEISVEMSLEGIRIQETLHRYENLRAFWIKQKEDDTAILILLTSQNMIPLESVSIPESIDLLELREFLLENIEEIELRESYTEKFMKFIGM